LIHKDEEKNLYSIHNTLTKDVRLYNAHPTGTEICVQSMPAARHQQHHR